MKTLLIVAGACLFFGTGVGSVFGNRTDEPHIRLRLTTGERSRDSSSQTTAITVERDAIVLVRTFGGRRRGTPALSKEFKLSKADNENLLKLIRANKLLVTDSIELPEGAPVFYFRISLDLALDGKKGIINLSGPRNAVAVKEKKLYQDSLLLVRELYRIMNNQDNSVRFEELIREPIRR